MRQHKQTTWCESAAAALVFGALVAITGAVHAGDGPTTSTCSWKDGFEYNGLTGVNATEVYNDGNGDALYIGGHFIAVNGTTMNGIVRWDGTTWSPLSGPSGIGLHDSSWTDVYDMEVYNGDLYVAGRFTTAGGVTVKRIARWNGIEWSALPGPSDVGVNDSVFALEVYNGDLYVGGSFTFAGGVMATRIARWDGSTWHGVGPAALIDASRVSALAVYGGALYVGGLITSVDGVNMYNIMRWDGSTFTDVTSPSGTGVDSGVSTLATFDDGGGEKLYVGGGFTSAGGVAANYIATWNGSSWAALFGPTENGLEDYAASMVVHDDGYGAALYIGGNFYSAGGVVTYYIARWDGTEFSDLYGPHATGVNLPVVQTLTVFNDGTGDALYAGGGFVQAGGIMSYNFGKWGCGLSLFSDGFERGDTTAWSTTVP